AVLRTMSGVSSSRTELAAGGHSDSERTHPRGPSPRSPARAVTLGCAERDGRRRGGVRTRRDRRGGSGSCGPAALRRTRSIGEAAPAGLSVEIERQAVAARTSPLPDRQSGQRADIELRIVGNGQVFANGAPQWHVSASSSTSTSPGGVASVVIGL